VLEISALAVYSFGILIVIYFLIMNQSN